MLNYLRGDKATIFMGSFFKYNAMVSENIHSVEDTYHLKAEQNRLSFSPTTFNSSTGNRYGSVRCACCIILYILILI